MFNRRVRYLLNAVAIAALLFAQAASAAQGCTAAADTPEMAFSDMDCADMPSQNVCLQQYLSGHQNSGTAQIPVAEVPDLIVLTIPASPPDRLVLRHGDAPCLSGTSDPPPSIRFCSFRL